MVREGLDFKVYARYEHLLSPCNVQDTGISFAQMVKGQELDRHVQFTRIRGLTQLYVDVPLTLVDTVRKSE